jgi:hypothetical protein
MEHKLASSLHCLRCLGQHTVRDRLFNDTVSVSASGGALRNIECGSGRGQIKFTKSASGWRVRGKTPTAPQNRRYWGRDLNPDCLCKKYERRSVDRCIGGFLETLLFAYVLQKL